MGSYGHSVKCKVFRWRMTNDGRRERNTACLFRDIFGCLSGKIRVNPRQKDKGGSV